MLKYLIFFTLILFIQNQFTYDEKKYLRSVYELTVKTEIDIIQNFKEKFEELYEILYLSNSVPLKRQISSLKFNKKEKDELEIDVNDTTTKAINKIKEHIISKDFRKYGNELLANLFTKSMEYDVDQWNKYDLLVCKGNTIKVLSILTKKISNKYVTIYFTSLDRLFYPYGEFVLINKSINKDNPFNNNYSMIHYYLDCIKARAQRCLIIKISSGNYITLKYADILIRYYSILSYNIIAQAIPENFPLPFE